MTFQDIFEDVARRTDKAWNNPDLTTKTRLESFINDRYRELMRLPGIIDLRDESFTFTTVSGRARYGVPVAASAINSIIDQARRVKLTKRTLAWIREQDPSVPAQVTGTPWVYDILNGAGVLLQPTQTNPAQIQVVSTAVGDTGISIEIEYQDLNGGYRVQALTLNGTTPVAASASIVQVFRMTILMPHAGTVTMSEAIVGGQNLIVIPPNDLSVQTDNPNASRNWVLHLWPTPDGAYTYTVDGSRPLSLLANPTDEPLLPLDFHPLLVYGATEDEMVQMDDTRSSLYRQRWSDGVKELRAFLHQDRGERIIPSGRRRRATWSPLGPNFPAFPS